MATKKTKKKTAASGSRKKKKAAKRKTSSVKKTTSKKKKAAPKKKPATKKRKGAASKKKAAPKKKRATRKKKATNARPRSEAESALSRNAAMRAEVSSSGLFKKLKAGLETIELAGQKLWIAEGDTLLDESELKIYAHQREKADEAARAAGNADSGGLGTLPIDGGNRGLVANTSNGKITKWPPGTTLTYRVVRSTFDRSSRYDTVVKNLKLAAADWERTCGIRFEHKANLDQKAGTAPAGAKFAVQMAESDGKWLALAFYPNAKAERRLLLISPGYFRTAYNKVGLLRHELGHVLGFRHEHIRSGAPPNCPQDTGLFTTDDLTRYDPTSVMHYFCGGVGSKKLEISTLDKQGAQLVYGPPIDDSGFIDI